MPGLWPIVLNAQTLIFDYNHFTLGGMADSTYEYLPKQHLMLGGRTQQYRKMYETAIEPIKKNIFFRPTTEKDEDVLLSGTSRVSNSNVPILEAQAQHLACFTGGMVGIAAKIFERPEDLAIAHKLVDGCIWAYNAMPTGLMPELFHAVPCKQGASCTWDQAEWYTGITDHQQVDQETGAMTPTQRAEFFIKTQKLPPGFAAIGDARYILRPEAIESVFTLYRITGDKSLQDAAWKMFQSIEKATRTEIANAAIDDVRAEYPAKSDRMESFWLAETLKYFYLIFSEPDVVSLDEYVL